MTAVLTDTLIRTQHPGLTLWRGRTQKPFASDSCTVPPFNRAVVSWNSFGPLTLEIEIDGVWRVVAKWSPQSSSVESADFDRDTLRLASNATVFKIRATPLSGSALSLLAFTYWIAGQQAPCADAPSPAWGRILSVPERSQLSESMEPGRICSPTSVAMVLDFHGIKKSTREVAEGVYDHSAKIYGNWPFNTAYAHAASGLQTCVRRANSLRELEAEIAAGRPVVASHAWQPGDLDNAPLPKSSGHLVVVIGFTNSGDVVVNDPAGPPGNVRRIYPRRQFHTTWLKRAEGILYVIGG